MLLLVQPLRPFGIVPGLLGVGMTVAIHFDDQPGFRAEKVLQRMQSGLADSAHPSSAYPLLIRCNLSTNSRAAAKSLCCNRS